MYDTPSYPPAASDLPSGETKPGAPIRGQHAHEIHKVPVRLTDGQLDARGTSAGATLRTRPLDRQQAWPERRRTGIARHQRPLPRPQDVDTIRRPPVLLHPDARDDLMTVTIDEH